MPNQWQRWKGIMKCYPFEESRLAKWKPPYICQPKYDGVRCRVIPLETGGNILLSSEENIIFSVPHINESFDQLNLGQELDGELYCHGMSFEQIISITSRTKNIHPDHKLIKFHLFDVVNENPQLARIMQIEKLQIANKNIIVAPFWVCENLDEIMKVYDILIANDYEGIIVRHLNAPYVRKRSTLVMKFKPKKEDNYEILGYEEERTIDGTPKDTLGSLVLKSGDGNTFKAGTGFSDQVRHTLWKERELLIGRVAKVQYQHLSSSRKVPRFPVFMEIIKDESKS